MRNDLREIVRKAVRLAALLSVPVTLLVIGIERTVGPIDIPPYILAFMAGVFVSGNPHSPNLFIVYGVIVLENFALLFLIIFLFLLTKKRIKGDK
jgi:hypothetical protein